MVHTPALRSILTMYPKLRVLSFSRTLAPAPLGLVAFTRPLDAPLRSVPASKRVLFYFASAPTMAPSTAEPSDEKELALLNVCAASTRFVGARG